MNYILKTLILATLLTSCKSEINDNSDRFKKGVFELPAGEG